MAENLIQHGENRGIHRLTMNHGPNALDRPLIEELRKTVGQLAGAGAPALILASSHPTLFCPGWNLKVLAGAGREEVGQFLTQFNALILEIFSYPGPTAAAIGGHAVAGGCSLAMACDLRLMVEGQPRLGISELNLGIPLPGDCVRVLGARLTSQALDMLVYRGVGCTAERAAALGIVHRAVDDDELLAKTERELGKLAARPRRAFVETKKFIYGEIWTEMGKDRPPEDAAFLDCWFETETHERIAEMANQLRQ